MAPIKDAFVKVSKHHMWLAMRCWQCTNVRMVGSILLNHGIYFVHYKSCFSLLLKHSYLKEKKNPSAYFKGHSLKNT